MGHQKPLPPIPASMLHVTYAAGAGATASVNPDPAVAYLALACAFDSTCRQMGVEPQWLADRMVENCRIIDKSGGPISPKVQ